MIVFVVGLYKSGTSLVSSLLEQAGVASIVDRIATTQGLTRAYDIKESYQVNLLNNKILDRYSKGCIWSQIQDLPDQLDSDLDQELKTLLTSFLDRERAFYIKDPRLLFTLRYWIERVPVDQDIKIVFVDRSEQLLESFQIDKWFDDKLEGHSYQQAIDNLKSNYKQTYTQYKSLGIEIDFDGLRHNTTRLHVLLYNFLTQGFNKYHKVFFHDYFLGSRELTDLFSKQTPHCSGVWNNVIAVDKQQHADFEIVQDKTTGQPNDHKLIFFGREPRHIHLHTRPSAHYQYHHENGNSWLPQTWWLRDSYDQLKADNNINKTKSLSIIDSGKTGIVGHNFRVDVIDQLVNSDIDLDVYGKTQRYRQNPKYKGELPTRDKTDGIRPYRFHLAIENGQTDYYFSEKICDAVLCNSFPIYWGCSRIDQFLPGGSYFSLDPSQDIVAQVKAILSIPIQQLNYNALISAKNLILDKYNLWPTIAEVCNKAPINLLKTL